MITIFYKLLETVNILKVYLCYKNCFIIRIVHFQFLVEFFLNTSFNHYYCYPYLSFLKKNEHFKDYFREFLYRKSFIYDFKECFKI